MNPNRDDVEALAATGGLLLEARDPYDLVDRFLAQAARLFPSDAGMFYLPGDDEPRLRWFGLERAEAARLAVELYDALEYGRPGDARSWGAAPDAPLHAEWPRTLAAVVGIESGRRGMVALFSTRRAAYDVERDGRLLRYMTHLALTAIAQARLHRHNVEHAERSEIRAEELERVRSALEQHSRDVERSLAVRSRFFALVSHELRTPINAILGYAELLHQGILGRLTYRQEEAVGKVATSARQLIALVDDVLDLSRIEAGRLEVQWQAIEVGPLVGEAVAAVELDAAAKGLELRTRVAEGLPKIRTDASRVRQILMNLLTNAVKYTDSGSVTIDIRHHSAEAADACRVRPTCEPGSNGWIEAMVEDTGPGIPRADLEGIFSEFVRLGDARGRHGTGLGLAISRRLASLLGGELMADSEVGVQSTFVLYLPCPAPVRARPRTAAPLSGG